MSKMTIKIKESENRVHQFSFDFLVDGAEPSWAELQEIEKEVRKAVEGIKGISVVGAGLTDASWSQKEYGLGTSEANELPPSSDWQPTVKKIKDLKKGEWFTLKPIEEPKESQVWELQGYDPSDRMYWAIRWSNISDSRDFKGDREVYTGFTF